VVLSVSSVAQRATTVLRPAGAPNVQVCPPPSLQRAGESPFHSCCRCGNVGGGGGAGCNDDARVRSEQPPPSWLLVRARRMHGDAPQSVGHELLQLPVTAGQDLTLFPGDVVEFGAPVYKEKYPAVQFEFRCNTRQEGDRAGRVAGACSENVGEFSFLIFLSLYADDIANCVESRAELEAIANELEASLIDPGLAMHVGYNGGAYTTVAMFIPAHGCSAQDGDTSIVTLNSGGTILFVEKFRILGAGSLLTSRIVLT
jgi:hypothetical protein